MRLAPKSIDISRSVVWALRVLWALLPLLAGPLFDGALARASRPVQVVGAIGLWSAWAVVLGATLVPSTMTLTCVRLIAPGAIVASIVAATRHVGIAAALAGIVACTLAALVALSASIGETFMQASAYGDERRFPLRPPGALLVAVVPIGWSVAAATTISGPLLIAAKRVIVGCIISVIAVVWDIVFVSAAHRLSRRFAVFVPAGFVLHDHVVLADTALFKSSTIDALALAPAGSQAANATGAALGLAVELRLREMATIVLAGTAAKPNGSALHVQSVLFSPTRPGRLLAEAAARGWS